MPRRLDAVDAAVRESFRAGLQEVDDRGAPGPHVQRPLYTGILRAIFIHPPFGFKNFTILRLDPSS